MKKTMKMFLFGIVLLSMVGCKPMNKKQYIQSFDAFITEVSENWESYDEKDWLKKTDEYERFAVEWYEQYKEEMSFNELMKVASLNLVWAKAYVAGNGKQLKEQIDNMDWEGLGKDLQEIWDETKEQWDNIDLQTEEKK